MKPIKLTDLQRLTLNHIKAYIKKNLMPPTIEHLASMGDTTCSSINVRLSALVKKGYISRVPNISRGIKIL